MPSEIVMPRLGWTMEVGRVVEWLKADGDVVEAGDMILAIESDKAVTEVEALDSGILRIPPDPQIGVELPVGAPLGLIAAPGEEVSFGAPSGSADAASVEAPIAASATGPGPVPASTPTEDVPTAAALADDGYAPGTTISLTSTPSTPSFPAGEPLAGSHASHENGTTLADTFPGQPLPPSSHLPPPTISPRARRTALALGVDWTTLAGTGSSGRIREQDIRAAQRSPAPSPSSPLLPPRAAPGVRRMAADAGVDLAAVPPGRPGGRITRADVRAASSSPPPRPSLPAPEGEALSPIRRVIVQRMTEAARTVAAVTLTTDADATELVRLRALLKGDAAEGEAVPTYNDLIARLVALALLEHPALNASLVASPDGDRIVHHPAVHLGMAVDTDRGLLVPVVRDADRKSAFDIATEGADLIARTRAGTAPPDALGGSTFTITNLGMHDVDAFTPIVNLPECAILGLGRIVARPVVVDDNTEEITVRRMVALSLTFDHRVVDGAPAARFLQTVRRKVERPTGWLMR